MLDYTITLAQKKRRALYRHRQIIETPTLDQSKVLINKKCYVNFASNDYLGLIKHPEIIDEFSKAIHQYGFGSGSSSFVAGFYDCQKQLEEEFAKWLNVEKTVFFNNGYLANIGILNIFFNRHDIILSDKLCHASLLDGIQLTRATHLRYQHQNLNALHQKLITHKINAIVTESVFSMEGDITPLKEISKLAKAHQSFLYIDDAHGIGWLGDNGQGIIDYEVLTPDDYNVLVLPLGKTFNAFGAIVAGKSDTIDMITQLSKSLKYTTALPPAITKTLLTTLTIIKQQSWRREALKKNIEHFNRYSALKNLSLISNSLTPIKTIKIVDNYLVLKLQHYLMFNGFFTAAIRPPTVAKNQSRLRISLTALHTSEQIEHLIDLIANFIKINPC